MSSKELCLDGKERQSNQERCNNDKSGYLFMAKSGLCLGQCATCFMSSISLDLHDNIMRE